MNIGQLQKRLGKPHRLRPLPWRFTQDGRRLRRRDDQWIVEEATTKRVWLTNAGTGHNVELGPDNVREFRTPDFLLLKCQVIIFGNRVLFEPIV